MRTDLVNECWEPLPADIAEWMGMADIEPRVDRSGADRTGRQRFGWLRTFSLRREALSPSH